MVHGKRRRVAWRGKFVAGNASEKSVAVAQALSPQYAALLAGYEGSRLGAAAMKRHLNICRALRYGDGVKVIVAVRALDKLVASVNAPSTIMLSIVCATGVPATT